MEPSPLDTGCRHFAGSLLTQENRDEVDYTILSCIHLRFGFEITMYIASR
ncbi:MAG: pyrroloquinoline quinone precursor peptide PqqA [Proteobacteria bacterium]|nr:pyrroloquinoline quinone precursor peptide PqqA [Pseudomonadota bacterium]